MIAERTIWIFLVSSSLSSFTERIISSPTTVVPYSHKMISSISYGSSLRYTNNVPRRSPAISIGVIIAAYLWILCINPSVSKLTFSFVDKIPSKRSFNITSICSPTSSTINSEISGIPLHRLVPSIFPFLLMTRIFDVKISVMTSQMSLNMTLDEMLLWSSLFIFLVLSSSWTLILWLHLLLSA